MGNTYLTLGEQLGVSALTLSIIGTMFYFFKGAILKSVDKSIQEDLLEKEIELNGKLLSAIENQKADIQKKLNEQNAVLEQNVLSAIEDQKADIQKKLNEQMADFQVAHTRYSYIKKEEIDAYKVMYGKLLKAYHKFRNYSLHKNSIKVFEADYSFFEQHVNQLDVPEQIKEKVLSAIKNHDDNAQYLFERAQVIHLHYAFELADKDQQEYFLENELFFSYEVCLPILKFQNRLSDLSTYYYLARWQSYEMAGTLCASKFGKLMNETEFRKDVDGLSKDLDAIRELIKKEIHEH